MSPEQQNTGITEPAELRRNAEKYASEEIPDGTVDEYPANRLRQLGARDGFIAGVQAGRANTDILKQQILVLQEKCAGYEAALEHRDGKIVNVIEWIREKTSYLKDWRDLTGATIAKTDAQLYDLYLNELRDNVKPE